MAWDSSCPGQKPNPLPVFRGSPSRLCTWKPGPSVTWERGKGDAGASLVFSNSVWYPPLNFYFASRTEGRCLDIRALKLGSTKIKCPKGFSGPAPGKGKPQLGTFAGRAWLTHRPSWILPCGFELFIILCYIYCVCCMPVLVSSSHIYLCYSHIITMKQVLAHHSHGLGAWEIADSPPRALGMN